MRKKSAYLSPKNMRTKYLSPQAEIGKYSKKSSVRKNDALTSRLGKIENNVRKQLDQILRKKNNFDIY